MKTKVMNLALIAVLAFGVIACGNKQNKTVGTDPEEALTASETAVNYVVDTEASVIDWKGEKPTGIHTGTIRLAQGVLNVTGNELESGDFVIDMNTIVVTDLKEGEGKENLEAHLKGTVEGKEGDFFDVTKYPLGSFEVTGIEEREGKTWLNGNLTLKEVTKNISIPVEVTIEDEKVILNSEPFNIDRTQWNVNFGSKSVFDNLGDKFINDDVELTVSVVANKA